MPLGVPVVPLVHRKIPPVPARARRAAPLRQARRARAGRSTVRPAGGHRQKRRRPSPRPGHREHPGQFRAGRRRVERDHHPACRHDGDQGGGVAERIRQPQRHGRSGRHAGPVQASRPARGGPAQPGIGQRAGARGVLQVGGVAPAGRRLVDPFRYHGQVPFWLSSARQRAAPGSRAGNPAGVGGSRASPPRQQRRPRLLLAPGERHRQRRPGQQAGQHDAADVDDHHGDQDHTARRSPRSGSASRAAQRGDEQHLGQVDAVGVVRRPSAPRP